MADELSQLIAEIAAESGNNQISQAIAEIAASSGNNQLSQLIAEIASSSGKIQISQLTIELARGPEVVPPEDNPVGTFTVGAGLLVDWYLVLQLSDSGHELRDKTVKSLRATGKFTSGKMKVYGYGPIEDVNVEDIEDGIGHKVEVLLDDSSQVQQSRRHQVNVKNAMMHTVRIEGRGSSSDVPDRVDEIVYEVARQGVRR